jgi:hypothetical protein
MSTTLGQELTALVENIHDAGGNPTAADLWRAARSRRRWAAARSVVAAAFALALIALVVWPGPTAAPAPPASPVAPSTVATYPSVIPNPHFASAALDAHRPMVATYVDGQTLYAVDDRGQTWKAPDARSPRQYAALSPNGRYATDGWAVYDFLRGTSTRLGGITPFPPDSLRTGAAWAADSTHFVVAGIGSRATVAMGTAGGRLEAAPPVPTASGTAALVLVSWLDQRTVLIVIPASPTPQDQTRGAHLLAFTWAVGSGAWDPRGALQLPPNSSLGNLQANIIGTSPDGQTVALPVDLDAGRHSGAALVTWRLPARPDATAEPITVLPPSQINIDGITWRGSDLVVVRGGVSSVTDTGQVLSRALSGGSRPISWRAGAFEGRPYYNSPAVWRDRLFVWAVLVGCLLLIGIAIRLAQPLARRAGILGDLYASPFPIEARWIFSLSGGAR